jgi:hypothetical protein
MLPMKNIYYVILVISNLLYVQTGNAQSQAASSDIKQWNANWIAVPNVDGNAYGVFYFRKKVNLPVKPASFIIHVSADNRYKLYVNGILVSLGPARGDTYYWNYETIDLAPYLNQGKNTVSALVFNESQYRPEAQITVRTAFIIQGNTVVEEILNTNNTWKCIEDKAYKPLAGFFAASSGEMVTINPKMTGWESADFDDNSWPLAANLFQGQPKGMSDGFGWMLVPSPLPQMELTYQRIPVLRMSNGITVPASFPAIKTGVTIPANTTVTLLLDQTYLTNAYITLKFSRGKNAGISLRYAESLFDNLNKYGSRKGNRDSVEGKDFNGREDRLISAGTDQQSFTTLYWRSFRYIKLTISTKEEPLLIDDIYGTFTGYPFKLNAVFNTENTEIKKILEVGWRTARLCAMETYFDCPYYEQLQYIGDTRIQAMISYYNSGDDRLARNAINLSDHSRLTEGVTQSRWPTHDAQIISTFSLWYIGMLHDYWMYRADNNFIKDKLIGERAVLDFFSKYQQPDGSLKNTPFWTFVDWANGKDWFMGSPPKSAAGSSAILDLQLLWAFQWAAEMESVNGMQEYAVLYRKKAVQLKQTIQLKYWDPQKKLYADTEDKTMFSQHTNTLAILTGMVQQPDLNLFCKRLLEDASLTQCTIYFKYYLNQALVKAGMGNEYMHWLDVWRNSIKIGLTTWPEESNLQNTRSDCHAWGASPNIEFFRTVLGIDSDAPGFAKIKIEPHLGDLTNVSGEIPHPEGKVAVSYKLKNEHWKITISIPQKTTGKLIWKSKTYILKAGENSLDL